MDRYFLENKPEEENYPTNGQGKRARSESSDSSIPLHLRGMVSAWTKQHHQDSYLKKLKEGNGSSDDETLSDSDGDGANMVKPTRI